LTFYYLSAIACKSSVAQVTPDTTLPNNTTITEQRDTTLIEGGTSRGNNLFHSFNEFSVSTGRTAHFNNSSNIQNIISRVTGKSISNIDGTLKANSTANLILINPNGIIFGNNASLNIGGSFIGSTANSVNFADNTKFSAIEPQAPSLLTVSIPTGLQFGVTAAPIRNESQASPDNAINIFNEPVGLQVETSKTLALVGGDIIIDGGSLTATGGQIELGSVGVDSLVSLNPTNQGWNLGYSGVKNFQNIKINGTETSSTVDVGGNIGGGYIQVQGKTVELIGIATLVTQNKSDTDGGDIAITTNKLIVQDGAQVLTSTLSRGRGGDLNVNASESVELIGEVNGFFSGLFSGTGAAGNAGDIRVNTTRLRILDGAQISSVSTGEIQNLSNLRRFIPATGSGGNITVNASEFLEVAGSSANNSPSTISAQTSSSGDAGKVNITTNKLIIQNEAMVIVGSVRLKPRANIIYPEDISNLGKAGELNVTVRSILLDNQGRILSTADLGNGGNISLQVEDLLLMRRNSQISTSAGRAGSGGDGGNITINTPSGFIVGVPDENSDITANAFFGSGGKVEINTYSIFDIEVRSREYLINKLGTSDPTQIDPGKLLTNDISAISQLNPSLNGEVIVTTPDVDANRGLVVFPSTQLLSTQFALGCQLTPGNNDGQFFIIGRGGLPTNPKEVLRSQSIDVGWVTLPQGGENRTIRSDKAHLKKESPIVEAQRWVVDKNGDVVLLAYSPIYNSSLTKDSCNS
jgi:filamentous hemagglutinin family protein